MVAPRANAPTMRIQTACLLPLLFASCFAVVKKEESAVAPEVVATQSAAPAQAVEAKPADDNKKEIAAKTRQLEHARLELKIERQKLAAAARKAQDGVETAEFDLKHATSALDHHAKVELPLALEQAQLALDRAAWAMEEDRQELDELLKLYAENQVEDTTKELVIQRSEKKLAFSKSALDHEQREMAAKKEHELPRKQRELERAKIAAEKELRDARADKTRVADENELELRKLEAKLDDLEREIKELGAAVPPEPKKEEPKKEPAKKDATKKDATKDAAPKDGAKPAQKPAQKPDAKPQDEQAPKAGGRS